MHKPKLAEEGRCGFDAASVRMLCRRSRDRERRGNKSKVGGSTHRVESHGLLNEALVALETRSMSSTAKIAACTIRDATLDGHDQNSKTDLYTDLMNKERYNKLTSSLQETKVCANTFVVRRECSFPRAHSSRPRF